MLFNSAKFALFFPIVTTFYFLLPHRLRWMLLLVASCVFYMAFIPSYILILLVTILIDYIAAIYIERLTDHRRKLGLLTLSIISTCLVLFLFKYVGFFESNVEALAKFIGWNYSPKTLGLILPIGLSFHTFQSLSYVIEVYRGHQKAEQHLGIYSLYVMFYPQLVAGPIERPQNLLHQFRDEKHFDYLRMTSGLRLMLWGLFKKVVIADRLAIYVNAIYADPSRFNGLDLVVATIAFAYQIYCDFSGYSDIAIGAARVMGFDLMKNFDAPYFSKSIAEFWKRWHISLSTWFRDYLYIPLGGNRTTGWRVYRNLLITFTASGLWHGASWNYVIWGALNGLYLVFGRLSAPARHRVRSVLGLSPEGPLADAIHVTVTFGLTCVAWIFFRADTLSDAWQIVTHLTQGWALGLQRVEMFSRLDVVMVLLSIGILEGVQLSQEMAKRGYRLDWPVYIKWPAYYALTAAIVVFGVFEGTRFIYFQF
jgi:alginate O-acetyltransferase complex protein AlgI